MATRIVDVLVPVALDQAYSYRVPDGLELAPGDVVTVPLGARGETTGVVWAENLNPNPRIHNRMKDVVGKHDVPPLKTELRQFVDWVAGYTLSARGMVLRMALRMGENLGAPRERVGVRLGGPPPARMTTARARVLALFADRMTRAKGDAAKEAGVSVGVVDGLIDEGALETVVLPPEKVTLPPDPDFAKPDFFLGQLAAADALRTTIDQGGYTVTLVDGVTGSGKTEVYFEGVAENIRKGRQTLILMPEIALTGQSLDRFTARFGVRPAEWHSQSRRARGRGRGRRLRPAKSRSSSARGRRCFCPMPILASSSSMKSTTRPTSRKTARTITPATWRLCAARLRKFPSCSLRRRPQSNRKSMRGAAAIAAFTCPNVSAARICRPLKRSTCGATARRAADLFRRSWRKP